MDKSIQPIYVKIMILIGFCLLANASLFAQEKTIDHKNLISITPLKTLVGKISIRYERKINSKISAAIDIQPMFRTMNPGNDPDFLNERDYFSTAKGTRIGLEVKSYTSKEGKKTQYYSGLGIFSGYHKISHTENDVSATINFASSGLQLIGGAQKTFKKGYFIDCSLNAGYSLINNNATDAVLPGNNSNIETFHDDIRRRFSLLSLEGLFLEPKFSIGFKF